MWYCLSILHTKVAMILMLGAVTPVTCSLHSDNWLFWVSVPSEYLPSRLFCVDVAPYSYWMTGQRNFVLKKKKKKRDLEIECYYILST